jgi:hypothetical protein
MMANARNVAKNYLSYRQTLRLSLLAKLTEGPQKLSYATLKGVFNPTDALVLGINGSFKKHLSVLKDKHQNLKLVQVRGLARMDVLEMWIQMDRRKQSGAQILPHVR